MDLLFVYFLAGRPLVARVASSLSSYYLACRIARTHD